MIARPVVSPLVTISPQVLVHFGGFASAPVLLVFIRFATPARLPVIAVLFHRILILGLVGAACFPQQIYGLSPNEVECLF